MMLILAIGDTIITIMLRLLLLPTILSICHRPSGAEPTDLLDLHPFMFTPGKPFQPRTNRTDCTSKLSQLRVYNPPPRARSATRGDASDIADSDCHGSTTGRLVTMTLQMPINQFTNNEGMHLIYFI